MQIIRSTGNKWSYINKPKKERIEVGNIEYYYVEDRYVFVLPALINNEPRWVRIGTLPASEKSIFTLVSPLLDAIYSVNNVLHRNSEYTRLEIEELIRISEQGDHKMKDKLVIYFNGTFDPINFNHGEIALNLLDIYRKDYKEVGLAFTISETDADNYKPNKSSRTTRLNFISKYIKEVNPKLPKGCQLEYHVTGYETSYDSVKYFKKDVDHDVIVVFGEDCYESIIRGEWTKGKELLEEFSDSLVFISKNTPASREELPTANPQNAHIITPTESYEFKKLDHGQLLMIYGRIYGKSNSTEIRKTAEIFHMYMFCVSQLIDLSKKFNSDVSTVARLLRTNAMYTTGKLYTSLHGRIRKLCFEEVATDIMINKLYAPDFEKLLKDLNKEFILFDVFKFTLKEFFELELDVEAVNEIDEILSFEEETMAVILNYTPIPAPKTQTSHGPQLIIVRDEPDLRNTSPMTNKDIAVYDYTEDYIKAVMVRPCSKKFEDSFLIKKNLASIDGNMTYESVKSAIDSLIYKSSKLKKITKEELDSESFISQIDAEIVYYIEATAGPGCVMENMAHFYTRDLSGNFKYKCTLPQLSFEGGFTFLNVSNYINNNLHHTEEFISSAPPVVFQEEKEAFEFNVETKEIDGKPYSYISENNMVAGIVYIKDTDEVMLGTQKRPYAAYSIEPAGGKIDDGESAMSAMVREAEEELSIDLSKSDIMFVAEVNCAPGLFTSMTYLYLITVPSLTDSKHRQQDENECVERYIIKRSKFLDLLESGGYQDVRILAMMSNKVVRMIMELD